MVAKLTAGGNVFLTKENPNLTEVVAGFGWNLRSTSGPVTEVVPSAILCNASGKAIAPDSLIFFNQIQSEDGSINYVSENDKEQIEVAFHGVPEEVAKIVFVVYIDPDVRRPGNFSSVREAYIRIADTDGNELTRFDIPNDSNIEITAMVFGELYRHNGGWKFRAVGQGYSTGLSGVAKDFGVEI
jgi:tellurium resistance protein TerD